MTARRAGDKVSKYVLLTDFTSADCTSGVWAFARRRDTSDEEFFIKRFMYPKYPADSIGGADTRQAKKRECSEFEKRQLELKRRLDAVAKGGGSVVPVVDFFREDSFFYKVTPKVDATGLTSEQISRLPRSDQLTLLLTTSNSLAALHSQGIVHGDVKPANILVKKTERSFAARLIDFDGSYVVSVPPPCDRIQGEEPYMSPEQFAYIRDEGANGDKLGTASDVFSIGVVFTEYVTGQKPGFDRSSYRHLFEAVGDGSRAGWPIPDEEKGPLAVLMLSMLQVDPGKRPSMLQVKLHLQEITRRGDSREAAIHTRTDTMRPAGLRGSGLGPPMKSVKTSSDRADEEPHASRPPELPHPPDTSPRLKLGRWPRGRPK
jgi:eukaryotic-like serine/threonine-protein kinase